MPFPLSSILDSGTGADADPIGGIWTVGMWTEGNLKRLSNQIRGSAAGFCSGSPTGSTIGPYAEFYFTISTLPTGGDVFYMHIKVDSIAATQASLHDYFLQTRTSDGLLELQKLTNGAGTVLTTQTIGPIGVGDSMGVQYLNGVLTGWYKAGAGAWTQKITATDTTYQGQLGYCVVEIPDATMTITNVGGGTIQANPANIVVKTQAVQQAAFF